MILVLPIAALLAASLLLLLSGGLLQLFNVPQSRNAVLIPIAPNWVILGLAESKMTFVVEDRKKGGRDLVRLGSARSSVGGKAVSANAAKPEPLAKLKIARAPELSKPKTDDGLLGIVVCASVSEAVDAKIRAQISAKSFPIKLAREDWRSDNTNWLLDIIAPNEAEALQMTSRAGNIIKTPQLHVHPAVINYVKQKIIRDPAIGLKKHLGLKTLKKKVPS